MFIAVALHRWAAYETNAFDLAFFDQIVWNMAHGRLFETSFVSYNFAGQHFEPILLLFVPAYWVGAGPVALLITQALAAAVAAVPLFGFARRIGLSALVSLSAVVAFLANPYLHQAIGFDFHPEVMMAGPAFASAWAAAAGRPRLAVVFALSTLLFKEDAVFVVLALAAFMYRRGFPRHAWAAAGVSVAYAAALVLVLMPLIRNGQPSDLVDRYGYLLPSGGLVGIFAGAAVAPLKAARVAFAPAQLLTLGAFLAVSVPLLVRKPTLLVWLVPPLGLALLSSHPEQRHLELHYAAEAVPIAFILSVEAAAVVQRRTGVWVGAALAGPVFAAALLWNPLGAARGEMPSAQHREALASAIALVPSRGDAVVSAQSGLLPRLSQREHAYEFPGHAESADWILVDRYGFRSSQSIAADFDERLAAVRATAELVFSADGVELYRRGQ